MPEKDQQAADPVPAGQTFDSKGSGLSLAASDLSLIWTFGHERQVASYFLGPHTSCAFKTYAASVVSVIMS